MKLAAGVLVSLLFLAEAAVAVQAKSPKKKAVKAEFEAALSKKERRDRKFREAIANSYYFEDYNKIRAYPRQAQDQYMKEIDTNLALFEPKNILKVRNFGHKDLACKKSGGFVCNLVVTEGSKCLPVSVENKNQCKARKDRFEFKAK